MKIGEAFKNAGLITSDVLETALKEQESTHDRLGDIMVRNGTFATEFVPASRFNGRCDEVGQSVKFKVRCSWSAQISLLTSKW